MYLDNAATSFPKPPDVCAEMDQWMRSNGAAYGRGPYAAAEASAAIVDRCRQQLAQLLGVPASRQIAFTLNCTDSLNLVLRGLLSPGDRVVTSPLEHNSVLRPLHQLQQEIGIRFEFVRCDPAAGQIDPGHLEQLLVAAPARLVVLTHASNVTGVVQPIRELTQMAHTHGALVLLDAAQTAGHFPLDMRQLGVDFLAAAGHKGLLGPLGTGILAIRGGREELIRPVRCGGTGTVSESLAQPDTMPEKFESGNLNLPGIVGLRAATAWLLEQTVERLEQQASGLTRQLHEGLSRIPGVELYPQHRRGPSVAIVSFNITGLDCREAAMILDQSFGIQCRAGLHCAPLTHRLLGTDVRGGTVRLSPGAFTTAADAETAIAAVSAIAASL